MVKISIPSTAITGNSTGIFTSPLNKLWRAKILYNRYTSGKELNKGYTAKTPSDLSPNENHIEQDKYQQQWLSDSIERHKNEDSKLCELPKKIHNNKIILINPNTSPYTKIEIQCKPYEIEVSPDSNWASVKSMGRNNPFMFYTGGEDTISFDISWYSTKTTRDDVIAKCRLLESWTRADGYKSSPPTVLISWGSSDIFKDDTFVLTSAKYTLSNFQNSTRKDISRKKNADHIDLGLYPNCATQHLVFKKVTQGNNTHQDIIPKEKLYNISGIEL